MNLSDGNARGKGYNAQFAQQRCGERKRELVACLRMERAKRWPGSKGEEQRGQISGLLKTPTACCASTCPRGLIRVAVTKSLWMALPMSAMGDRERTSGGANRLRCMASIWLR